MKHIEVERPSAKQLSRLRNGHPVRLKKGEGLMLIVHPERFDLMSKTFQRGKARTVALSPEEWMANMKNSPEAHQEQLDVEENRSPKDFVIDKSVKLKEPKSAPATGAMGGTGLKKSMVVKNDTFVSNIGGPKGTPIRTAMGVRDVIQHLGKIGDLTGHNYTNRLEASMGASNANAMTADMGRIGIETARANYLLPRERMSGEGLYGGRGMFGGRGHIEKSSIGVGGTLLGGTRDLPVAMQSQPYATNWQFQFTLPPSFQKFSGGK